MKTYYLSLIDQPRDQCLLVSDKNTIDYKIASLYRDILENHPKVKLCRCKVYPMYIIPNEDLSLFRKYAIFIENQEITYIPDDTWKIFLDIEESEGIVSPPDYSDEYKD